MNTSIVILSVRFLSSGYSLRLVTSSNASRLLDVVFKGDYPYYGKFAYIYRRHMLLHFIYKALHFLFTMQSNTCSIPFLSVELHISVVKSIFS
jgi:hypothetical protein